MMNEKDGWIFFQMNEKNCMLITPNSGILLGSSMIFLSQDNIEININLKRKGVEISTN
jgi:hypothetical protein